jgi:sulfonate transport system ATP-binding protein
MHMHRGPRPKAPGELHPADRHPSPRPNTGRRNRLGAGTDAESACNGTHLSLRNVEKRFGTRRVLQALSLEIDAGAFIAIVGRSGCGKSTLLRLIADLDEVSGGTICLHAANGGRSPRARVLANVALGLPTSFYNEAMSVLREVGLADRADDWPSQLSGGQRQRVALARALLHRPDLLLLDEPLGALDALTRIEMHTLIERLWKERGFTALLVTHDVQEAVALADRVLVVDNGDIAFDCPIDLPRPRARGSASFARCETEVLARVLRTQPNPELPPPPEGETVPLAAVSWAL